MILYKVYYILFQTFLHVSFAGSCRLRLVALGNAFLEWNRKIEVDTGE